MAGEIITTFTEQTQPGVKTYVHPVNAAAATATPLAPGATPTVQLGGQSNGQVTFAFGIPAGPKGDRGMDGSNVVPADTAVASYIDGASSLTTAALQRRWTVINVRDHGAKGDGTTDDTNAIKAAITAARARSNGNQWRGSIIYFPRGRYLVSSTITITAADGPIVLRGDAPAASMLTAPNAVFTLVHFDGDPGSCYNCGLEQIGFDTPGNATGGYQVDANDCIYFRATDVHFLGHFRGVRLRGCGKIFFRGVIWSQETRTGGAADHAWRVGGSTYGPCSDVHFADCQIMRDVSRDSIVGCSVGGVDGLYVTNSHFHSQMFISPTNTGYDNICMSLHVQNTYFDASRGPCVRIEGSAATAISYQQLLFTQCIFRSGTYGLSISTGTVVRDARFIGCSFFDNTVGGVHFANNQANGFVFMGCNFSRNTGTDLDLNGLAHIVTTSTFTAGNSNKNINLASTANFLLVTLNQLVESGVTSANRVTNQSTTSTVANNLGVN